MKTLDLLGSRPRTSSLILLLVFVASPILAATGKDSHGDTYSRKTGDGSEFSKNSKEPKLRSRGNGDSTLKSDKVRKESSKVKDDNGSDLSRFLENVLRAQDDLKWIDQAVRNINHGKDWEKSPSARAKKYSDAARSGRASSSPTNVGHGNKLREKRGFDRSYEATWTSRRKHGEENPAERPRRVFLDTDMLKRDADDPDFPNSLNDKARKEESDDQILKDVTKTEDLCSLSDWLNKNPETDRDKRGDRWIRGYDDARKPRPDSDGQLDGGLNARNERDSARKEEAPSLEALKETVLELKKSLNEGGKRVHEDSKNVDSAKIEERGHAKEDSNERRTRGKNKHEGNENEDNAGDSSWWAASGEERSDLKKRERSEEDPVDKSGRAKVWRAKRTEANNDEGNPKLFHRAGFGEPFLEEESVKELHDRKRRSKGTPADEKRDLNEATSRNGLEAGDKNSMKMSEATRCSDADKGESSNDGEGSNAGRQESTVDDPSKKAPQVRGGEGGSAEAGENYGQSDLSRAGPGAMEYRGEAKAGNLEGNSLRAFGSAASEPRQPVSTKTSDGRGEEDVGARKTEGNRENVGSDEREQLIKVPEPQGRLYENGERTKDVEGVEASEERGKLSEKPAQKKRSTKESGNINILVKSENKNLIKFSNAAASDERSTSEDRGFVMNRFDVKKKLIVENEETPGKSMSTIFNARIEKAQVDAAVKGPGKRGESRRGDGPRFVNDVFDPGKNKANEELYEDTPGFTNDLKQRNVDEERLKNSAEFNKGTAQSGDNEGPRNWYEGVPRNQMGINIDQSAEGGHKEGCEEKFGNEEERGGDGRRKGESIDDPIDGSSSDAGPFDLRGKIKDDEVRNRKRYNEVVILADGTGDRKVNEGYLRRRVLQYAEYSNDAVEDADSSYGDKEEDDNLQQGGAKESDAQTQRKERSPSNGKGNPVKAKVNVLIKEKMAKKKKKTNRGATRKRRNPRNVIEYYDYDSEIEQRDRDASSATSEQQRVQNVVAPDTGLVENLEADRPPCMLPGEKKNEHMEEVARQQEKRKKLKNKEPKEEFIVDEEQRPKNTSEKTEQRHGKSFEEGSSSDQHPGRLDQREGNANDVNGGRLSEPSEEREERCWEDGSRDNILSSPDKYILILDQNSDAGPLDDFLEDVQPLDQKNERTSSDVEPLYEELKKLYDWTEDESRSRPRLKGDQRMYSGANEKLDLTSTAGEPIGDQVESPEIQSRSEMSDSSPNLLPLLLVHDGSGASGIEGTATPASPPRLGSPGAGNVSQRNYFALKSTDDMFKGGSEQSNSTGEKLRGPGAIGTAAEWQTQKVNGAGEQGKDAASWSLTDRGQYIDTDSRSPYENRKYMDPPAPGERARNIDREKQTVISSGDLHESFVEPFDWIDDFDGDARVRLGRGLKTFEETNSVSNVTRLQNLNDKSSTTIEKSLPKASTKITETSTSRSETFPSVDEDNVRVRREVASSYDDTDENDSEKMDYDRYLKNEEKVDSGVRLSDSYRNIDREKPSANEETEDYDTLDEDRDSEGKKVARSAGSKKKHKKRKKHYGAASKKQKRKDKAKYSKKRRQRRQHKKHATDSKSKKHDQKKHKKRTSKNAKKSRASQGEDKVARRESSVNKRRKHQGKMENEDTPNLDRDSQRKRISLLLEADNMEDESQIESALHGELAGKIVKQIFDQVQKNEDLKVSVGPGLYLRHKTDDAVTADKTYRQALNDDDTKHTEELLKKVMMLLNRMIFDEVQRKTCVSLPPDLIEFLDWMLGVNPRETSSDQVPSLPLVHDDETPSRSPKDKFLFSSTPDRETEAEIGELYKKLGLMKSLIKEYGGLSEREKTKVRSVHDYLAKQLDLSLKYIEAQEAIEKKGRSSSIGAAERKNESVVRYQMGMSDATNRTYPLSTDTFSPLMNAPNLLAPRNASFLPDGAYFYGDGIDYGRKGRRIIRSVDNRRKKHGTRKQRKGKHRKRHKGASTIDQSRHRDTEHKAAASRQKRGYLEKDFWDSFDSGYEEPLIYTFVDELQGKKIDPADENGRCRKNVVVEGVDGKFGNLIRKREIPRATRTTDASSSQNEKEEITETVTEVSKIDFKSPSSLKKETNFDAEFKNLTDQEEPITGKNQVEDEVLLLNKRQAWRKENEEQLEEVAFGEDMRKGLREKELFEKLTEIDKERSESNAKTGGKDAGRESRMKPGDFGPEERDASDRERDDLSREDRLRMLEEKINVYSDNDWDTRGRRVRGERKSEGGREKLRGS